MRQLLTVALLAPLTATAAAAQGAHPATEFTVRIENVSTATTLKLSNGQTAPAPTAPVLWVVHTNRDPLFTDGARDRGQGLEALAEDGNPARLAEALRGMAGIVAAGAVNMPEGDREPGPILPGKAYQLTFSAHPGQKLTLAFMFGQSNDLFYAPYGAGIELFDASGKPLAGDITAKLVLWDAGTEVNQEPGLGPDQAPRQRADNTGADERGTVRLVSDGFTYPKTGDVIRVTVTPKPMMMGNR
jgi:hypothetical protein